MVHVAQCRRACAALLVCVLATCAPPTTRAQPAFDVSVQDINAKFDLGLGPASPPAGTAAILDTDGFALSQLYYSPQIATAEGNTSNAAESLSIAATPERGVSGQLSGFVTASGKQFVLNGKPFYCAGTNAYYAALRWIMSENEVPVMFKEHAKQGATVIRVFAHSNFDSPTPMMPEFGKYNEDSLKRLDLTLAAAAQNNIRLILVLSNFWPFLGGIQAWVDKGLGPGRNSAEFYSDAKLRGYYKDWVKTLVTRTNTVTGQRYVDDPTIFAWELMNEPRLGLEGDYEQSKGLKPGKLICDWVREMAPYVKSLDSTHMVTTGEEGFRTDGSTAEPHSWISNGYTGVDFSCNVGTKAIDFATIHTYPGQWGMQKPKGYEWLADNFFKDRAQIANGLGKPIMLEEYGQAQNYYGTRESQLEWQQSQANKNDFACTLVWAEAHYSTDKDTKGQLFGSNDNQGYVFSMDGDGSVALRQQYAYMKAKTGGTAPSAPAAPAPAPAPTPALAQCTDTAPPGGYSCAQQAGWGKCGEAWMQGCKKSCGRCQSASTCTDTAPPGGYSCAQQAGWGKCGEPWMQGCKKSCGRCS